MSNPEEQYTYFGYDAEEGRGKWNASTRFQRDNKTREPGTVKTAFDEGI